MIPRTADAQLGANLELLTPPGHRHNLLDLKVAYQGPSEG